VPWALLYLILLGKMLDSLKRLGAVNSFTANRAGVVRNGEIVAAQFHDLEFFEGAISVGAIRDLVSE
jgi:hypothetical protein